MRRLALLAALLALPIIAIAMQDAEKGAGSAKEAPAFDLKDTKGTSHSLGRYSDKILVLEWTEPGCPYAIRHAKAQTLAKIQLDYRDKGVVVLGVCTSKNTDTAAMQKFIDEHKIAYPVLMDPTGAVGKAYRASNTPHVFVIRGGKILYSGAFDDDPRGKSEKPKNYVRQALDEILAGKAVSTPSTEPYGCSVKYPEGQTHERQTP